MGTHSRVVVAALATAYVVTSLAQGAPRVVQIGSLLCWLATVPAELALRFRSAWAYGVAVAACSATVLATLVEGSAAVLVLGLATGLCASWRLVQQLAIRAAIDRAQLRRRMLFAALTTVLFFAVLEGALAIVAAVYFRSPAAPEDDSFRVVAMGDSFTYGVRLPREQSYPAHLQRLLEQRGVRWQVINFGRPGHSPLMLHHDIDRILADSRPNLVVLMAGYNINDGDIREYERAQSAGRTPKTYPLLLDATHWLSKLRLYRILRHALVRAVEQPFEFSESYVPDGIKLLSFDLYQRTNYFGLQLLLADFRERKIPVVLMTYPQAPVPRNPISPDEYYFVIFQRHTRATPIVSAEYLFARHTPREIAINGIIRHLSHQLDIPLVDNFSDFLPLPDQSRYFLERDEHANGAGCERIARGVIATFERSGLIPAAAP